MAPTRRALLASAGLAAAGSLAGCTADSTEPTSTDEGTLEPFAELRAQPSPQKPGTIRAGIRNRRSGTVTFGYGPRLFLSFRDPEAAELAIDRSRVSYRDGCWRQNPEAGTVTVISTSREVQLAPGDSLAEEYYLYAPPEAAGCVPPGTYEFHERLAPRYEREGPGQYLLFVLRVTVAEDGTLSVTTEGPTPDS